MSLRTLWSRCWCVLVPGLFVLGCRGATGEGISGCRDVADCPAEFPFCREDMRCWSTPLGTSPDAGVGTTEEDASRPEPDAFTPSGFDPRGPGATAETSWTIEGEAPSSVSCAELGIAELRIAFLNGSSWYQHPDLVAPCAVGRIDTRPTPVILVGTWTVQVQALDAAGAILARGEMATLTVVPRSHLIMDQIDFRRGSS